VGRRPHIRCWLWRRRSDTPAASERSSAFKETVGLKDLLKKFKMGLEFLYACVFMCLFLGIFGLKMGFRWIKTIIWVLHIDILGFKDWFEMR
jgi:hypothetical protein